MNKPIFNTQRKIIIFIISTLIIFLTLWFFLFSNLLIERTFVDENRHYSFEYPGSWGVDKNNSYDVVLYKNVEPPIYASNDYEINKFGSYVRLKSQSVPKGTDLSEYIGLSDLEKIKIDANDGFEYKIGNVTYRSFISDYSILYEFSYVSNYAGNTKTTFDQVTNSFSLNEHEFIKDKNIFNGEYYFSPAQNRIIESKFDFDSSSLPFDFDVSPAKGMYLIEDEFRELFVVDNLNEAIPKEVNTSEIVLYKLESDDDFEKITSKYKEDKFEITYVQRGDFKTAEYRDGNTAKTFIKTDDGLHVFELNASNQVHFDKFHPIYRDMVQSIK